MIDHALAACTVRKLYETIAVWLLVVKTSRREKRRVVSDNIDGPLPKRELKYNAIVITTTNGTTTFPSGCNDVVVYCVFRPNGTTQGLDTWEIDADQEGYCVNRNAWKETGESLFSQSYLNDLSCPLSSETLALVQSLTETNLVPNRCNVTESRPSSAQFLFQNPPALRTILAKSDEQSCANFTTNQTNDEESCLTVVTALFLNENSNAVQIEEVHCDAAQDVIGFRLQISAESPKGTPGHPLCGGTEWEISVVQPSTIIPRVSAPAGGCEVCDNFLVCNNLPTACNLTDGGLMKVVDGSSHRITISEAEQNLGEFTVQLSTNSGVFSDESFRVELLYDSEVILRIDVENADTAGSPSLFVPFVIEPSKGTYKIANTF
ncbi:uncharacterized protein [Oscarella lobularis]|uniref:uncharacterized protein isoform X2 n=1 Tax=Oscarella lobularis TaxID=121494 RepID=UPI003313A92B